MNIGGFIGMIFIASVVLIGFGIMIDDFELNYIDSGIVNVTPMNASFRGSYNTSAAVEENFRDIEADFNDLSKQDSWWEGLGDFIGAIPLVIISFPAVIIKTMYDAMVGIKNVLGLLGIPPSIVIIAGVALVVWLLIRLLNFWKTNKPI